MKIWITTHCKERYAERINDGKFVDVILILKNISAGKDITEKIYNEIPRYILFLYEKYGELGQKIIKHEDVIYLLKKVDNDNYNAITCFKDMNGTYLEQFKKTALSREEIFFKIKVAKMKKNYSPQIKK